MERFKKLKLILIFRLTLLSQYIRKNGIKVYGKNYDKVYPHLLMWGEGDKAFDLMSCLKKKLKYFKYIDSLNYESRLVPMTWTNSKEILVNSFIWVALLPIIADK